MQNKPTAILSADWHIIKSSRSSSDKPICRKDDYWQKQKFKIKFIAEIADEHNIPLFFAGDMFDKWDTRVHIMSEIMQLLSDVRIYACSGNHDLPYHNSDLFDLCALKTIKVMDIHSKNINKNIEYDINFHNRNIKLLHQMTYIGNPPWPGCNAHTADVLFKKFKEYDLIVTGDNHKPFVVNKDGRLLVNPGSLMRMSADQIDHKPRVYLWYAESNTVEEIFIPIEEGVISREHIINRENTERRIESFISSMSKNKSGSSISFDENIAHYLHDNRINKKTKQIVMECLNGE